MLSRIFLSKKFWAAAGFILLNTYFICTYSSNKDTGGYRSRDDNIASDVGKQKRQSRTLAEHPGVDYQDEYIAEQTVEAVRRVPPVILYNRVPKTGSTTFANIAYKLTEQNGFHMLHINTTHRNFHYLNYIDQQRFVANISQWRAKQPAIYHGHLNYLDFTRFGYPNPIYINIVRDPIERLVSYYYFLRNGDDYRPHVRRAKASDTKTFDQCVAANGNDCNPEKYMWIQIPFFCGQSPHCEQPSKWALEQAKATLLNHYLVVGLTEQLDEFVALIEAMLPEYFSGAYDLYSEGGLNHLRKTKDKKPPTDESLDKIKLSKVWKLENEFYLFAKEHFNFLKSSALTHREGGKMVVSNPKFRYEKIFPDEKLTFQE